MASTSWLRGSHVWTLVVAALRVFPNGAASAAGLSPTKPLRRRVLGTIYPTDSNRTHVQFAQDILHVLTDSLPSLPP